MAHYDAQGALIVIDSAICCAQTWVWNKGASSAWFLNVELMRPRHNAKAFHGSV
jgi:hypothetical protein